MRKRETKGSIITKLCTLVAFLVFIVGGAIIMFNSFKDEKWPLFGVGCFMLAIGFFFMGVLCPLIMWYENHNSLKGITLLDCLKAGFMVMIIASCLVFCGISIILWISRGLMVLGLIGIAVFVVMILIAIEISIDFQTNGATKKVMRDENATEHLGVVTSVKPHFPIILFFKTVYLFYEYVIEIDGVKSVSYLKRGNRKRRHLDKDSHVKVKFNPDRPKNCAILAIEKDI